MGHPLKFASVLLIFVLVTPGFSSPLATRNEVTTEGEVTTIRIDKIFDLFLPLVRQLILEYGLDPTKLPDLSETIIDILPGKLKGEMDFTEGWMQEFSQMRRGGPIYLSYGNKVFTLDLNLSWDILEFNYKYLLKYLLIKRTGDVYGLFKDLDCNAKVTIDLENYSVTLKSLKFVRADKFRLKLEGHVIDPLLNLAIKAVTTIFRQHVLKAIQDMGFEIFTHVVDEVNGFVPKPGRITDKTFVYDIYPARIATY